MRLQYYQSLIYPTVIFDGTDNVFEPNPDFYYTTFNQHISIARSVVPYYNLSMNATASDTIGNIQLNIVTADTIPNDSILTFVAICEDSVRGYLKDFNYVLRHLYYFPIYLSYPDSLDTTIIFNHSIPINKMHAVVFVQDMDKKEVMQATTSKFEEVQ